MNTTTPNNLLMNAGKLMLAGDPAFAPDLPAAALLPQAVPAAVRTALPLNFAAAMLVQQQQQVADDAVPLEQTVMPEAQLATLPPVAQSLPVADVMPVEEAETPIEAPDDTLASLLLHLPAQQAPLPVRQEPAPVPLAEEEAATAMPPPPAVPRQALPAAPVETAASAAVPVHAQAETGVKAAVATPALKTETTSETATETTTEKAKPQAGAVPAFASVLSAVEPARNNNAAPVLDLPTIQLAGDKATSTADAPSQLLQALGDRIQLQIAARSEQALIRLDPPQMGRVEIAIARQDGGAIEVRLSASHGEVQRQLQQGSESLRLDLAQRHGGDVSVQVSATPRDADARHGGQRQPSQQQHQQQQQPERQQPGRALMSTPGEQPATPFELA